MLRADYIQAIADTTRGALVLTTAGGAMHEWWAHGDNRGQLQVRTLGLSSSIGLGLALALPHRTVIVLDGDGALFMNLHTLVTCAARKPPNLLHICFDNGVYESSGGTPTFSSTAGTDLGALARAAGIPRVAAPTTVAEFAAEVAEALQERVHTFIHTRVEAARPKVPLIGVDEVENKYRFARYVEATEGISVLAAPASASHARGQSGGSVAAKP